MNEDQLANLDASNSVSERALGKRPAQPDVSGDAVRDLWTEEGDEFFGHSASAAPNVAMGQGKDDDAAPVPSASRGKRRKVGNGGTARGRKNNAKSSGGKRKSDAATGDITLALD